MDRARWTAAALYGSRSLLWSRGIPKCLAVCHVFDFLKEQRRIIRSRGYVIAVEFGPVSRRAQDGHKIRSGKNGRISSRLKSGPISYMCFRPEEMHTASGMGPVFGPLPYGDIDISAHVRIASVLDDSVSYHETHGCAAIQAGSVNANGFSRKDPADCQGFESSLSEPFLFTVNSDTVLGG
jgi:hypothetical protein